MRVCSEFKIEHLAVKENSYNHFQWPHSSLMKLLRKLNLTTVKRNCQKIEILDWLFWSTHWTYIQWIKNCKIKPPLFFWLQKSNTFEWHWFRSFIGSTFCWSETKQKKFPYFAKQLSHLFLKCCAITCPGEMHHTFTSFYLSLFHIKTETKIISYYIHSTF